MFGCNAMRHIRGIAGSVTGTERAGTFATGDLQLPLNHCQMLARTACVWLTVQQTTWFERHLIDLVFTGLFWRRQNTNAAAGPQVINGWYLAGAQRFDLRFRHSTIQQTRKIHLQRAGKVPQRGNRGAALSAFNLADHRARNAGQFRNRIEGKALIASGFFQAGGKVIEYGICRIRHMSGFADMAEPVNAGLTARRG